MKNLFLTLALMCSVSFAFANDGDKKENPERKETIEQKVVSNAAASFRVECFGLSCRTVCYDLLAEYTSDEYVKMWRKLDWTECKSRWT